MNLAAEIKAISQTDYEGVDMPLVYVFRGPGHTEKAKSVLKAADELSFPTEQARTATSSTVSVAANGINDSVFIKLKCDLDPTYSDQT